MGLRIRGGDSEVNILVVDDEESILQSMKQVLAKEGYRIIGAATETELWRVLEHHPVDLILLDLMLSDTNRMELLKKIKEVRGDIIVIMLTAYGDLDTVVQAVKLGAYDFISKPFDSEEIRAILHQALETVRLKGELARLQGISIENHDFAQIIGTSAPMVKVFQMVKRIASYDATTVLLEGESGTEKELIAQTIHFQSDRHDQPFVELNCTALPETLLESELLGYEEGALTDTRISQAGLFEQVHGVTLFLDEIGEMKLEMQSKLLRLIQEKRIRRGGERKDIPVDVRIVAATSRPLEKLVQEGRFREDLYYRLKVFPISLPPLRERREDIPLLIRFFIDRFNRSFGRSVKGITKGALEALQAYSWPGNVWELRNVIERAMILAQGEELDLEDLPLELVENSKLPPQQMVVQLPPDGVSLELVELELIRQALERTRGNQTHAARLLHLHRLALRHRMEKYGLLPAIHSYRRLKRENGLPRPNSKPGTRGSQ